MIRFCQPNDYRHRGRNLWFNPSDVMKITDGESYSECVITLRNGETFTVAMTVEQAAGNINDALKEGKSP